MMVMRGIFICGLFQSLEFRVACRAMTLGADRIPFGDKFSAVRLVAVGAAHALCIHFALQERAIDIDLINNLTVSVVEAIAQERELIVIGKFVARRRRVRAHRAAPRMTACAQPDFLTRTLQWQ